MSITSIIGNITRQAGGVAENTIASVTTALSTLTGTAGTAVSTIFPGGFVGIDKNNILNIQDAINKYCEGIDQIIQGFDENAQLDNAYKGKMADGVRNYVGTVKKLLSAYVTLMRQSNQELNEAISNYDEGVEALRKQIEQTADEVRSKAESIRMD